MTALVARRTGRPAVKVGAAAATLGVLAFAADGVDGAAGQVMTALTSSGLAWGSAALLAGWTAAGRRSAVIHASALLVTATLVYYLLILVVSRRWSGAMLVDGSSADLYGLRSVAIMTTAWLMVSLVAGPALGVLGHIARTATVSRAAPAAGIACGLLSGQGWQETGMAPLWPLLAGPDADISYGFAVAALTKVVVPVAILVWLATARRLWRGWPILLTAMISTAALSALLWHLLYVAAVRLH